MLKDCLPDNWVANLGKAGVNARHHLIQIPAIENYMPRFDRFVVLMGLNDFLFDLRIHHPATLPKDWWQNQALMYRAGREGNYSIAALLKRLAQTKSARNQDNADVINFGDYQQTLRDAYAKVGPDQWVHEMPDLKKHLDEYGKTILRLKKLADSYGAEISFVTQPYVWNDNMSAETRRSIYAGFIGHDMNAKGVRWYTPAALRKGLNAYNHQLMATCQEHGLHCIDAAQVVSGKERYFYDDFHFSEEGAIAMGKFVAEKLCSTGQAHRK